MVCTPDAPNSAAACAAEPPVVVVMLKAKDSVVAELNAIAVGVLLLTPGTWQLNPDAAVVVMPVTGTLVETGQLSIMLALVVPVQKP